MLAYFETQAQKTQMPDNKSGQKIIIEKRKAKNKTSVQDWLFLTRNQYNQSKHQWILKVLENITK